MKKTLITITIAILLLNAGGAMQAQNSPFKYIMELPEDVYSPIAADSFIHFMNRVNFTGKEIVSLDKNYQVEEFDIIAYYRPLVEAMVKQNDTAYWLGTDSGLYVFKPKTDSSDIKVLHHYSSKNIKGFARYKNVPDEVFNFCFDETGEYIYFMPGGGAMSKMSTHNPDSVEYQINIPIASVSPGSNGVDMEFDGKGRIWYALYYKDLRIVCFDTATKEFTIFRFEDPASWTIPVAGDCQKHIVPYADLLTMPKYKQVFVTTSKGLPEITSWYNVVAVYDNDKWDTLALPYHLIDREINGKLYRQVISNMVRWSDDEIAFYASTRYSGYSFGSPDHKRTLLIYNLATKEWSAIYADPDYLSDINSKKALSVFPPVVWQGKKYVRFFGRQLYLYDPEGGIDAIPEPTIIKNYSLFPNPASDDCTLSMDMTEAGSISISLSDMLGRDIMQIYDGYADIGVFSKAFNTKHLASGVYSVIIRIGDKAKAEKLIINR